MKKFITIISLAFLFTPSLIWADGNRNEASDSVTASVNNEAPVSLVKKDIGNGDIRNVEVIMDYEAKADDASVHHTVLNGSTVPWYYDEGLDRIIISVSGTTDLLIGRSRPGIFRTSSTEETADGKKTRYSMLYEFYLTQDNTLRIIAYRWK